MMFSRTSAGKVAAFRFYQSPLIWVEGPEDVEMFSPLARQYGCILKSADGKHECSKLIEALRTDNHAYAVLIDGDYTILEPPRRLHRRVIQLRKYSAENYLYVEDAVRAFCLALTRYQGDWDPFGTTMSDATTALERDLSELVVLDIARDLSGADVAVLPRRIDHLFHSRTSLTLSPRTIQALVNQCSFSFPEQTKLRANELLHQFLNHGRFTDVLNGHLLLGIIRRIVLVVSRRANIGFSADDKLLRITLAGLVWHRRTSSEHRRVMDRIRRAVTEIQLLRWPRAAG